MKATVRLLNDNIQRYSPIEFKTFVNNDLSEESCVLIGRIELQHESVIFKETVLTEYADRKYSISQCDAIHALTRSALNKLNAELAIYGRLHSTEISEEIEEPLESYKTLSDIIAEGKGCVPYKEAFVNGKYISVYRAEGWRRGPYIISVIETGVADIESLNYQVERNKFEKVEFLYGAEYKDALKVLKQYIEEQLYAF